jgi:hypothetical protein
MKFENEQEKKEYLEYCRINGIRPNEELIVDNHQAPKVGDTINLPGGAKGVKISEEAIKRMSWIHD